MRFAFMVDPEEGLTYTEMREFAVAAEASGFEAFERSDHWASLQGNWACDASDAWTTLAGLARDTREIRLGTMVTPVTFRSPVALAKAVTTVDEMSGGRVSLGLGAGWYEAEHERFGIPFPPMLERYEMLEEQLQIVLGLWTEPSFTFDGAHYRLRDAICEPKPVQRPHPPIVLGGEGRSRMLRLTASYADELDLCIKTPDYCREAFAGLDAACARAGRDPETVRRSVMIMWDDAAEAEPLERQLAMVAEYEAAGVDRLVVNAWPGAGSVRMIERFGREIIAAAG